RAPDGESTCVFRPPPDMGLAEGEEEEEISVLVVSDSVFSVIKIRRLGRIDSAFLPNGCFSQLVDNAHSAFLPDASGTSGEPSADRSSWVLRQCWRSAVSRFGTSRYCLVRS